MTEAFSMAAPNLNSSSMTPTNINSPNVNTSNMNSPNMNSPNMNSPNMNSPNMNTTPCIDGKPMSPHGTLPEPDSVKMFVGQIPKTMDEEHLRPMFEEYGPVYHLNVLRKNNEHKGCCFVTYYTGKDAEKAKKKLHNSTHLPGMKHPIQMKPADHEKNAEERKLFVGMLNKKFSEDDVRVMFAPYGTIEQCTVLRDAETSSKGCAFVQFTHKYMAQNAIKELHHSTIMEGCSSKLVVKIADTIKEKEQKRQTQIQQQLFQQFLNGLGPQCMTTQQGQSGGGGNPGVGGGNNTGNMPNMNSIPQLNLQGLNMPQLAALLAMSQQGNNAQTTNPLAANPLAHNPSALSAQNTGLMGLTGGTTGVGATNPSLSAATTNNNAPGISGIGNAQNASLASAFSGFQQQQASGGANLPGQNTNNGGAGPGLQPNAGGGGGFGNFPNAIAGNFNNGGNKFPVNGGNVPNIGGIFAAAAAAAAGNNVTGNPTQANAGGLPGFAGMTGTNNIGTTPGGNLGNNTNATKGPDLNALSQAYAGIQQYAEFLKTDGMNQARSPNVVIKTDAAFHNGFGMFGTNQQGQPHSKQTEGPEGSNLFIYHLPPEFGDLDLIQSFAGFGTILSAKVYIDKKTNLSKCFGFVSYNDARSAQSAIQAMNGFQIGTKRLKVQLKRSKDLNKPY